MNAIKEGLDLQTDNTDCITVRTAGGAMIGGEDGRVSLTAT
ncbi:hypothetical protein [Roseobacter sp. A03A-229]